MTKVAVVVEHIRWCRSQGWTPERVVASVGLRTEGAKPGWDDAYRAIAIAYDALRPKKTRLKKENTHAIHSDEFVSEDVALVG